MSAFDNVAARLKEHLPFKKGTEQPITAWADQAKALNKMAADVNGLMQRVAKLEGSGPPPDPQPEPEPEPTPQPKYAPRAYNSMPSADARFCTLAKYGVVNGVDQMGVHYDESGRDLGGRSKNIVPGLKGADSMDGKEPCEQYVGPTGMTIGGDAGYPAASFEK